MSVVVLCGFITHCIKIPLHTVALMSMLKDKAAPFPLEGTVDLKGCYTDVASSDWYYKGVMDMYRLWGV